MDFVRFSLLAVFVITGIATTIVSQLLNYGGAANKWNMLIPFFNYLGMYAVKFIPMGGESKVTSFVGNNKCAVALQAVVVADSSSGKPER